MRRAIAAMLAGLAAPAVVAASVAASGPAYTPGPHNVAFPEGFERHFIRYAVIDNAERKIIRFLYVNPEAFSAARPGEALPHGTVLVMADSRARLGPDGAPLRDLDGRLIPEAGFFVVAVQQKEPGWGEGYPPERRNGEWEYASFTPSGERRAVRLDGCFSCHLQARAGQDFTFAFWDYVQARGR
ncbi:MAG: cytochrome P460 family protein [Acetobacteraceae bacterium]|jgi:hypothetical protein|nr:cytochrome P460 family protein [Acetobacteraceae bacterium]